MANKKKRKLPLSLAELNHSPNDDFAKRPQGRPPKLPATATTTETTIRISGDSLETEDEANESSVINPLPANECIMKRSREKPFNHPTTTTFATAMRKAPRVNYVIDNTNIQPSKADQPPSQAQGMVKQSCGRPRKHPVTPTSAITKKHTLTGFLDLPQEIRDMIYEELVVRTEISVIPIGTWVELNNVGPNYCTLICEKELPAGKKELIKRYRAVRDTDLDFKVFNICRQVAAEAKSWFFKRNMFSSDFNLSDRFSDRRIDPVNFIPMVMDPNYTHLVRKLKYDIKFSNNSKSVLRPWIGRSAIKLQRMFPAMKKVVFRFLRYEFGATRLGGDCMD